MSQQKKILFLSLYSLPPAWLFHHQLDATVATALRMRGCDVLITGCDGLFESCYILRGTGEIKQQICELCSQTSKGYFCDSFHLPYKQLRDFVLDNDYNLANEWLATVDPVNYAEAVYDNLAIGQWVTSSVYTYFRITSTGLSSPDVRKVHRQYLIDGLVTYKAVSRLIYYYQPTHLFLLGARLAPSRIAFEVARQHNIDTIVQEKGYINNSYLLLDNHGCMQTKPARDVIEAWENIPLNNSELLQVKKYWLERETGQNFSSFYNYQTEYASVRRQLNIPEDAKIFAVFTSSEDELAAAQDYLGISQQLDIIDRLIEVFADKDEYLVIRHHPNIAGREYLPAQIDFIVRAYQQSLSAPKNVRIVMPSEQLTSYALLWHTDAAIAFFSTMSIEAVAKGIPTAIISSSLYSFALRYVIDKFDIASLRILVDSLFSESAKTTVEDLRRLYRFTNAYFFKFSNEFRSFNSEGLSFESNNELKPGIDPTLDKVCNRVLYGSSLYNLPGSEEKQRSLTEENEFLEKYILEIRDFRQKVKQQGLTNPKNNISHPSVGVVQLTYNNEQENQFLSQGLKRSRYQAINEYKCNYLDLEDHKQTIESILALLETIPEDYILLAHSNIQYHESLILSAMQILLADGQQVIQGVSFGGWLPINQNRMLKGKFLPQGIFIPYNQCLSYEEAVTTLPWLKYPPSLLAFTIMRKTALVKNLDMLRHIPTREQAAELLFMLLHTPGIHTIENSMMFIREIPQSLQKLLQKEKLISLQEYLNLKDINLIIFPDWSASEEFLLEQFAEILRTIFNHPDAEKITLLIDIDDISEDEASLILSSVTMNLLMEDDLDLTDKASISLLKELSELDWEVLVPNISARIAWEKENQQRIHALVKSANIPIYKVENLVDLAVV
ncbi:MAG: hypothetical protein RMX96_32495 [Nostoc sp. ChiSLP02]|nr:hypothetical protein [Nostoc sp. DedSLP05]MDZ8101613.1 hypothetical protein [Nostoc sp. DedSLP01]MDZ8189545.1 hypothetical protein [Nostoc sp. ChiSLP02]